MGPIGNTFGRMDQTRGPKMLKRALARKGWSQGDLERELGAGDAVVSKWVNGVRTPGLEYALAIERLLGVPASAWVESARTGTSG